MAKKEKLIDRFLLVPKDFTWDELTTVMSYFGFEELSTGKTSGSRRKFANDEKSIINLHKPHPGNIVKQYAIKQAIATLKEKGKIKNE